MIGHAAGGVTVFAVFLPRPGCGRLPAGSARREAARAQQRGARAGARFQGPLAAVHAGSPSGAEVAPLALIIRAPAEREVTL